VRNVHRWAAHLMVICVAYGSGFYTGSYKRGREFNWLVGLLLLVLTLALSFTWADDHVFGAGSDNATEVRHRALLYLEI